jgi:hypothetical protein
MAAFSHKTFARNDHALNSLDRIDKLIIALDPLRQCCRLLQAVRRQVTDEMPDLDVRVRDPKRTSGSVANVAQGRERDARSDTGFIRRDLPPEFVCRPACPSHDRPDALWSVYSKHRFSRHENSRCNSEPLWQKPQKILSGMMTSRCHTNNTSH